jgi:hypothetical protein
MNGQLRLCYELAPMSKKQQLFNPQLEPEINVRDAVANWKQARNVSLSGVQLGSKSGTTKSLVFNRDVCKRWAPPGCPG